jgi:hypothetical protein
MNEERHSSEYVTLKEYFESKLIALEKGVTMAANSLEKRLDSMNEFRGALKDLSGKMLTRDEFTILHQRIEDDVRMLRESRAAMEGKADQSQVNKAMIISIISIIISVIMSSMIIIIK